ncbi:MAG: transposase, partial [Oscillospiraceae bacterium]
QAAKESEIPEFKNAITAYTNWFDSIINSCGSNITNGYTEGCNNKIKVIKRNAYGYRDFERFRKSILHAFACSA